MRAPARWLPDIWHVPAGCAWGGCGHPAEVDVVLGMPDEPAQLAVWLGSYCIGHAVITGIEAQRREGGHLWYVVCPGGEPLAGLN